MSFWVDFWAILGWMLWAVVFIGYLFALFAIVGDLFRDRELNGWWKAVWIVFLIFLPFLTALVYIIARGEGMAERSDRAARNAETAAQAYIRDVAGKSPSEEIAAASALLESGSISQEEFDRLKAKALA
ncbi:SHOCT domain-containing protein [Microbacterium azadirachtae]|uniref:Phospholipase_D-nuclease N-terminal n=1 Tax=Microbacterium azadirachtae TaxID=582680 RepID=A0A1I6G859_9MICO|nr:SHOCT domain-containing protein [Microbacterium azadirachtae]SDL37280.1 Phospholipase_D-nuclease N-terminal [Microbacterium azadirachtae]SEF68141.1 Phospholipase_D-nuclease N-terminal [Microbacterium azadirachtae]SEF68824.1 Phospholipase_D-nuclease N-terminal [Microbacterium azadirachtae]SFR38379.1 Phospholipase_D-nuclease N-terminal [Microbacterium azadirachtae]